MIDVELLRDAWRVGERTLCLLPGYLETEKLLILLQARIYDVLEARRIRGDVIDDDYLAGLVDMLVREANDGKPPSRLARVMAKWRGFDWAL